jgi:hypothetical protein
MIRCDQFLAHLGDYMEDDVAAELRQQLQTHLAECRSCQVLFDSTSKAIRIVTDSGSFALPPDISEPLLEKIMSKIRDSRHKKPKP